MMPVSPAPSVMLHSPPSERKALVRIPYQSYQNKKEKKDMNSDLPCPRRACAVGETNTGSEVG